MNTCLTPFKSAITDFRNNNWGDTKENVITKEGSDYTLIGDSYLAYTRSIIGIKCEVTYSFKFLRLNFGIITFELGVENLNLYI